MLVTITPAAPLSFLKKYSLRVSTALQSASGGSLGTSIDRTFITSIDSSRKFPAISTNELLTRVQQQTFKYFWDFAHPVSGLARERSNGDDNVDNSVGAGFGIMAVITGIHRNFMTRHEGSERLKKMVSL